MPIYTCPYCRGEIKNEIRAFKKHRLPDGECDQIRAERPQSQRNIPKDD